FHRARQCKRIRGNDTHISLVVEKKFIIEGFRIDNAGEDDSKNSKLVGTTDIVAITAGAVHNQQPPDYGEHLLGVNIQEHAWFGLLADPAVVFYAHGIPLFKPARKQQLQWLLVYPLSRFTT